MTQQKQQRKVTGMNVGSASLVMVFSVLCLTIFAVLSVVTARNEWTLAKKTADAVTAYYTADSIAVEVYDYLVAGNGKLNDLLPLMDSMVKIQPMDEHDNINYYVPIDGRQSLWVQLHNIDGTLQIVRWQVQGTGDWVTDQSIDVWGG